MSEALDYSTFEKRYKDKEYIGAGGFGKVYKVFDHAKNHYVALKVSDVRPEWKKFTLKNEVELVNRMDTHRNIARYDACYRYNTGITGEMDFAILKFYEDGNLEQFLKKQSLDVESKKVLIQGVLEGIQFLHRNNVIHRDLKAENILMSREDGVWCPKITDFGLSREVSADSVVTNSAVGISYSYAAPEQILNQKIYKNVDLWAAGVMIYRIIEGELPFKGRGGDNKSAQSQLELSNKIVNVELPESFENMAEPFRSMIKACLIKDPKERAQTSEVLLDIFHGKKRVFHDIQTPVSSEETSIIHDIEEKTELIFDEKQKSAITDEPPAAPPTPEQFHMPEVPVQPPQVDQSPNYQMPEKNVTQILHEPLRQREEKKQKEEDEVFRPNTGGDTGGVNLRHILIFLAVLVASGAGYGLYSNPQLFSGNKKALPQVKEEVSVIPVKKELNKFKDLDLTLEQAADPARLESALSSIQALSKDPESKRNYRILYLRAKLGYLAKEPRYKQNLIKWTSEAVGVAKYRGNSEEMLTDMRKDEKAIYHTDFSKISRLKTNWEGIKEKLN